MNKYFFTAYNGYETVSGVFAINATVDSNSILTEAIETASDLFSGTGKRIIITTLNKI